MSSAAEEAVAVGQHLEGAGAANDLIAFDLLADNGDDELDTGHASVFDDSLAFGEGEQTGHGQAIKVVQTQPGGGAGWGRRRSDGTGSRSGRRVNGRGS